MVKHLNANVLSLESLCEYEQNLLMD